MKQYIKIGKTTFEINKKLGIRDLDYKRLSDCYDSYSYYKERAYREWEDFLSENALCSYMTIASYNSMMFTLYIEFTDRHTGESYIAYITRDHNYIRKMTEEEILEN